MREVLQSRAVVLSAIPFKERDKILTLFTEERGVIKLFVKGNLLFQRALFERFTLGEFLFSRGKGELFLFCDGTVEEQHLNIRASLEGLEMGEKISAAILSTQWEEKEAPHLFALVLAFLKRIPEKSVWAHFLVKLLKHEGVLQLEGRCVKCERESHHRFAGERYCRAHAPPLAVVMSVEEERGLQRVFEGRAFAEFPLMSIDFEKKMERLFHQVYDQSR